MKRFMLMILTVSLIVAQFAACSKGGEETKTANIDGSDSGGESVVSTTEEDENTPDLPDDANFGGYEFRVINTLDEYVTWLYKTLIVEEETGEALNDAIYKRNSKN